MIPQLPQNWLTVPLRTVCEIVMGQAPAGDSYNEAGNGVPLLAGAGDLGPLNPKPKRWTESPTKIGEKGDIIICVRATIGDLNWADRSYCYGRGVAGIRVHADYSPQFIWYWLSACRDHLVGLGRGATFKQISKSDLQELRVPKLGRAEQDRLVSRLKECTGKLAEIETLRSDLLRLCPHVFRALRRELLGDPDAIPSGWAERRLDELAEVIYGISAAIGANRDPSIGPPIVRMANISKEGHLDLSDLRYCAVPHGKEDHFGLRRGDLLLNWRSGSSDHVGKTAVFDADGYYTCASFILRIRAKAPSSNNRYLRHVLNFMRAEGIFSTYSRMQINHKLNASEFSAFPIRVPPTVADQESIADQLDAAETLALRFNTETEEQLKGMTELRSAILRRAFGGEL